MKLTADDIADLHDAQAAALLRYLARRTLEPEVAVDLTAETFARAIMQRRKTCRFSARWAPTCARRPRESTDEGALACAPPPP